MKESEGDMRESGGACAGSPRCHHSAGESPKLCPVGKIAGKIAGGGEGRVVLTMASFCVLQLRVIGVLYSEPLCMQLSAWNVASANPGGLSVLFGFTVFLQYLLDFEDSV